MNNPTPPKRIPPQGMEASRRDPGPAAGAPASPGQRDAASKAPAEDNYVSLEEQLGRLENQFQLLKDQLRQTQRLASIGTAAAMLAHEFNNLFTPIVSYAKYSLEQDDVDLMKKALQTTLRQAAVISSMSDRILGLAMDERQDYAAVPAKTLVEETVDCLGRDLAKDGIQLTLDIPETLAAQGNINQLQQVFFNLILNARHAMLDGGGALTIKADAKPGDFVEIQVADTGDGIRPEYLEHIFNPFFTTKRDTRCSDKKGLGLGLAVTKDIIEEHGGTIACHSALNQGTTFIITLPAAR